LRNVGAENQNREEFAKEQAKVDGIRSLG